MSKWPLAKSSKIWGLHVGEQKETTQVYLSTLQKSRKNDNT